MRIREWNEKYSAISKKDMALYRRYAARQGFSDAQFWILYILCDSDGERTFTQYELSELLGASRQTVNSAAAKLKALGYVELAQMQGPRNRKALALTRAGREVCASCVAPLLAAEDRALQRISQEENERFLQLYEKRYEAMRAEILPILEDKTT